MYNCWMIQKFGKEGYLNVFNNLDYYIENLKTTCIPCQPPKEANLEIKIGLGWDLIKGES